MWILKDNDYYYWEYLKVQCKHVNSSSNYRSPEAVALAQVFSFEFCEISKNTFFLKNASGGCFWKSHDNSHVVDKKEIDQ